MTIFFIIYYLLIFFTFNIFTNHIFNFISIFYKKKKWIIKKLNKKGYKSKSIFAPKINKQSLTTYFSWNDKPDTYVVSFLNSVKGTGKGNGFKLNKFNFSTSLTTYDFSIL